MPSSVLHNKIPHSILFPNQPLLCLPPRVFGCVCFIHILTPRQDKLSVKATKCVFLGYSRFQRGYHCYSPDTHRYFVSADVTFFENSSMFPINHPPSSNVISLPLLYPIPNTSHVPPATLPQPLQVYTRHSCTNTRPPAGSSPMAPSSTTPILSSPADLHIVIRKDTRSSHNPHPIYNFLTYHRLSSSDSAFVSTLSSVYVPQTVHEALSHSDWKQTMVEEMATLLSSGTRDLVTLPTGKTPIGCRRVCTVKIGPNGQVDRLKARLVAKGYTQVYGSNFYDTFSHVASVFSFLWLLCNLGLCISRTKKCLLTWRPGRGGLYGATIRVCCSGGVWIGMQTTPLIIWPEAIPSNLFWPAYFVVREVGMTQSTENHSVFYHHTNSG